MPIQYRFNLEKLLQPDFHEIDYQVMRHAYDIQNELGRLCHESIYQNELVNRCKREGLSTLAEGEIIVTCDSFQKSYFIDALVNHGIIYELKAVTALNGQHESQLLNYLFLSDLQHGKLINFSSTSVQHRFVSTNIGSKKRFSFTIDDDMWVTDVSANSTTLREIVQSILNEWGAFLDIRLYREAIFHFLGGEEQISQPVNIFVEERMVGHQKICLLDKNTGLHISSTVRHEKSYGKQLLKILEHSDLEQIQWINFNRDVIHLTSLKK